VSGRSTLSFFSLFHFREELSETHYHLTVSAGKRRHAARSPFDRPVSAHNRSSCPLSPTANVQKYCLTVDPDQLTDEFRMLFSQHARKRGRTYHKTKKRLIGGQMAITKVRISGRKFHQKIARDTHFRAIFSIFFHSKGIDYVQFSLTYKRG
jgi:hypothetical protein